MVSYCKKAALCIFLGLPITAFAHITMEPREAPAGSHTKLTFRVPHGCEGSPTVKITVEIPDGVFAVKPQVHTGWEIEIHKKKLSKPVSVYGEEVKEAVSEVSWSGGALPDEYMDEFGMSAKLPNQIGAQLLFPVVQKCKKGTMRWAFAKASGHGHHAEQLPAPTLLLTKPAPKMDHMSHH